MCARWRLAFSPGLRKRTRFSSTTAPREDILRCFHSPCARRRSPAGSPFLPPNSVSPCPKEVAMKRFVIEAWLLLLYFELAVRFHSLQVIRTIVQQQQIRPTTTAGSIASET